MVCILITKLMPINKAVEHPISLIFKKSEQRRQLPAQWKKSLVIPLFKKDSHNSSLKYRPISLTSVCCKILETDLAAHLYE